MPYPGSFHRLVVIGTQYTDIFNFGLSIVPVEGTGTLDLGPVDDTMLASIATVVGTWFPKALGAPGPGLMASGKLTSIKLNRIGADGRYVDPSTKEHIYATPIAGGNTGNGLAQAATAVTITTAFERGRGSRGRFYLPSNAGFVSIPADGRMTAANALSLAQGAKNLIDGINAAYATFESGDESLGRVGVASNAGAGVFRPATGVSVGRVVDTIRSRRNKLVEDPSAAVLA